ncbi:unnamed protein product, partial [Rotaria magnacalcarata]
DDVIVISLKSSVGRKNSCDIVVVVVRVCFGRLRRATVMREADNSFIIDDDVVVINVVLMIVVVVVVEGGKVVGASSN